MKKFKIAFIGTLFLILNLCFCSSIATIKVDDSFVLPEKFIPNFILNEASKKIYFINQSNKISVLDLEKKEIVGTIDIGDITPQFLTDQLGGVIDKANQVLIIKNRILFVVDSNTDKLINSINLLSTPSGLAIDQSTGKVWITYKSTPISVSLINDVSKNDIENLQLESLAVKPLNSVSIFHSPVLNKLILVVDDAKKWNVYLLTTDLQLVKSFSFKSHFFMTPIAFNPETGRMYTHALNKVVVVDIERSKVLRVININQSGKDSSVRSGIAINSNSNEIFVPKPQDNKVIVISGKKNKVIDKITVSIPIFISVDSVLDKVYVLSYPQEGETGSTLSIINR